MSSSCKTASQNHAMSELDRRINSSSEPMPCRSMNRFKWLCAINSGVGRHTISPPNSNFSMIPFRAARLGRLSSPPAQLDPSDLAADRLGQFLDELDFTRVLVRRSDPLAVVLQLALKVLAGRSVTAQHHERLYDLTAHRVGLAHHGGFEYGRMLDEGAFDFERADAIAGAFDHVIRATDKPVVSFRVAHRAVPGEIPATLEPGGVLGRVAPVFPKQPERMLRPGLHRDLPFPASGQLLQLLVEQRDRKTWRRMPHRAGAYFVAARTKVADQLHGFRLAVAFIDGQSCCRLPRGDNFRIERFAGADAVPQPGRPKSRQIFAHNQ